MLFNLSESQLRSLSQYGSPQEHAFAEAVRYFNYEKLPTLTANKNVIMHWKLLSKSSQKEIDKLEDYNFRNQY